MNTRRQRWAEAGAGFDGDWPELELPSVLKRAAAPFAFATAFLIAVATFKLTPPIVERWFGSQVLPEGLLAFSSLGAFYISFFIGGEWFDRLTRRWGIHFRRVTTIGELARCLAARGSPGFSLERTDCLTREHIAGKVRAITLEQLGIDPAEYGEDKHFVRDFGAD